MRSLPSVLVLRCKFLVTLLDYTLWSRHLHLSTMCLTAHVWYSLDFLGNLQEYFCSHYMPTLGIWNIRGWFMTFCTFWYDLIYSSSLTVLLCRSLGHSSDLSQLVHLYQSVFNRRRLSLFFILSSIMFE